MPSVSNALVSLLLVLAACGAKSSTATTSDGGSPSDGLDAGTALERQRFQSGTRLRAKVIDAGGGARLFAGWYDSVLHATCWFHSAKDGTTRCLPSSQFGVTPSYGDATCSSPVVGLDDCVKEGAPFVSIGTGLGGTTPACGTELSSQLGVGEERWVAYRIGDEVATRTVYGGTPAQCQRFTSEFPVYTLDAVDLGELVVAHRRIEPRGASLAVEVIEGEDGSIQWTDNVFDVAHLTYCTPSFEWGILDDYRCLGGGVPPSTMICSAPDFLLGCAGEQIPLAQFPPFFSELVGTARVRLSIVLAEDDTRTLFVNPFLFFPTGRFRPGPFWDTETQKPCSPMSFQDGTTRCMPMDAQEVEFIDPACSVPIVVQLGIGGTCGQPADVSHPAYGYGRASGCGGVGPVQKLYNVGSARPGSTIYHWNILNHPPTCDAGEGLVPYYELTPADPSVLPALTASTE